MAKPNLNVHTKRNRVSFYAMVRDNFVEQESKGDVSIRLGISGGPDRPRKPTVSVFYAGRCISSVKFDHISDARKAYDGAAKALASR